MSATPKCNIVVDGKNYYDPQRNTLFGVVVTFAVIGPILFLAFIFRYFWINGFMDILNIAFLVSALILIGTAIFIDIQSKKLTSDATENCTS